MKSPTPTHICTDTRAIFRAIRLEHPQVAEHKLHAIARLWAEGVRNITKIMRETGISKPTMMKMKDVLRHLDDLEAAKAGDLTEVGPQEPVPTSKSMAETLATHAATDGTRIITGPQFVAWLDKMMETAQTDDDVQRMEKLFKMRNEIIDFAAEMPVTHIDIERTVGLEGLQGMDGVLVDTLTTFFDEIDHYPQTKQFLTETFRLKPAFWKERCAAN